MRLGFERVTAKLLETGLSLAKLLDNPCLLLARCGAKALFEFGQSLGKLVDLGCSGHGCLDDSAGDALSEILGEVADS